MKTFSQEGEGMNQNKLRAIQGSKIKGNSQHYSMPQSSAATLVAINTSRKEKADHSILGDFDIAI